MTDFFRFPRTPHLAWLGPVTPRADKVLSPQEARDLLSRELIVEEKVDGANLGFSVDTSGALRAQNRGNYLDTFVGQWKPLNRWLSCSTFSDSRMSPLAGTVTSEIFCSYL